MGSAPKKKGGDSARNHPVPRLSASSACLREMRATSRWHQGVDLLSSGPILPMMLNLFSSSRMERRAPRRPLATQLRCGRWLIWPLSRPHNLHTRMYTLLGVMIRLKNQEITVVTLHIAVGRT